MGFTRSTTDISVHQKLGDYPNQDDGLSADELKKRYDYPAETLQKDFNNLEVELEKESASTNLGASALDENDDSEKNVQAKLNKIYDEFKTERDSIITTSKIQDGAINADKIEDFSVVTNKIADSNVTTEKIADGAITSEKIDENVKKAINIKAEKMNENDTSADNVQAKINKLHEDMVAMTQGSVADNSITTSKIVNGAITELKIIDGFGLVPRGLICMWSGSLIPTGWYLCDGTNGTPDLRDRFIVGAGNEYSVGDTGGEKTHKLTTDEMPAHNHDCSDTQVRKTFTGMTSGGAVGSYPVSGASTNYTSNYTIDMGTHSHIIGNSGSDQAHENRPPYYALAFIMKA